MPKEYNARFLDSETRLRTREIAFERHRDGERIVDIARSLGVDRGTIYEWIRARKYADVEVSGAEDSPAAGGVEGLSEEQRLHLLSSLDGNGPRKYGFDTDLWSRYVVGLLIQLQFHVLLEPRYVETMLVGLGFPLKLFGERASGSTATDPDMRMLAGYAEILRKAERAGADLLIWHEQSAGRQAPAAINRDPHHPGGLDIRHAQQAAPRATWAVNRRGGFWFCSSSEHSAGGSSLSVLKIMMSQRMRPCSLLVDARIWNDTKIQQYATSTSGKLTLHPIDEADSGTAR
jgi:transposase